MTARPVFSIDPSEPRTAAELNTALAGLLARAQHFLQVFPDAQFFAPQGQAWSPAEHVRHLRKSTAPVARALGLPKFLIGLRFGKARGESRSFSDVRTIYRAALEAGGQAGRYAPSREPSPASSAERRSQIMTAWAAATTDLQRQAARWPEPALDRYRLPHPLLGLLTVREMLAFTVYHTAHHLDRIAERGGLDRVRNA